MSLRNILSAASQGASGSSSGLYVDDVFSTYLYTGNGSTQTINNGIDLAGSGGLVWCKERALSTGGHALFDTSRGATKKLATQAASAQSTVSGVSAFNSSGFTLGADTDFNGSLNTYASWTFRKAPKFFDCGTYTGNGVAGRQIPHSLGIAPGMVIVKRTDTIGSWAVYHRMLNGGTTPENYYLLLNSTNAQTTANYWANTAPTASVFSVIDAPPVNNNGATYVWYAFAHDTTADGIIQCGSFTTDASGNATVNLGWEPQFVVTKAPDQLTNWNIMDSLRGMAAIGSTGGVGTQLLQANISNAEIQFGGVRPTALGFNINGTLDAAYQSSTTYIYLAIRRPNKPPTTGTQVYNAIARTGTGASTSVSGAVFSPDLLLHIARTSTTISRFHTRLLGPSKYLESNLAGQEVTSTQLLSFNMAGYDVSPGGSSYDMNSSTYIEQFFKRAPGVFDIVCCTPNGVAHLEPHGLGVPPEMIIGKHRDTATSWYVYHASLGNTSAMYLNTIDIPITGAYLWNNANHTASGVSLSTSGLNSTAATQAIMYLFATKPGVSKVGSYTGNGSSQTVDMGFSTGARFFLVKASSTTGNWWMYDSARGIVAAVDPALAINSAASSETVTADAVDPHSSGILVNQEASCSINANGVSYIYLAIS